MANIYDVAKRAGVSIATVSAVINNSAYVSPKLRRRVEAAIQHLDYRPNLLARSLAKQQTHTIGVLVPDVANPFFPDVVRGAEDRAHAKGYSLLLANTDNDPQKEEMYLNLFLAKRVDGLLITRSPGKLSSEIMAKLEASGTPVVNLMRTTSDLKCDSVVVDDRDAGYEAASHLLRLGYRRIGMITGVSDVSTGRLRVAGYRQALKDWGVKFDRTLVKKGDFRVSSGYAAGLVLLKKNPEAVFVSNYLMTVGFMKAMWQYQLRCPEDIAVVTCDDYPWLEAFQPRLTTIDFPKYNVGVEAVNLLVDRISDRNRPVTIRQLKSVMRIRDSCGYTQRVPSGQVGEPLATVTQSRQT